MALNPLAKFRFPIHLKSENLPTLTLAIPARNETLTMVDCLNHAQASHYQKMEVIVLDDQSSDGTSDVIRGFAHSGIRFIAGATPAAGWIGKTYAEHQLEKAASGEFIAFMNVDVNLAPDDLAYLLTLMKEKQLDMVSVLPRQARSFALAALLEPLRAFRDVVRPLSPRHTPVGHQFWIIRRSVLSELGGIAGQSFKVSPEEGLARRLIARGTYRFFVASGFLRTTSTEDLGHQYESAVRRSFPDFHRKLRRVVAGVLGDLVLLAPYLLLAWQFCWPNLPRFVFWPTVGLLVAESLAAIFYAALTRHSWFLAPLFFPLQLALEIAVSLESVWKYRLGTVDWRGRDIKLVVTQPQKHPTYRPAEEYLGNFRVVRDKNQIKKHRHR